MRTLLFTIVLLFSLPAFAADYTPITKDNEVATVDQVQIKEATPVTQERTWTLAALDAEAAQVTKNIATYQKQITEWQAYLTKLEALRPVIETEANKVQLKAAEQVVEK